MVLGNFQCGDSGLLGQGPTVLAVSAGWGILAISSVPCHLANQPNRLTSVVVVVVVVLLLLLFYVDGKHLRSCRDGQLT